jgi:ubiquinone/menaquinone biosynthesis C-methylase UbiE
MEMLHKLSLDAKKYNFRSSSLNLLTADLNKPIPLKSNSFNLIYTLSTMHIIANWRLTITEFKRILRKAGYYIYFQENNQFMHQTEGFEHDDDFPYLNETLSEFMRYYHRLRDEYTEPYIPKEVRYSDPSLLLDYAVSVGFERIEWNYERTSFQWQKPHSFNDILDCFRLRGMTTWGSELNESTRQKIADKLEDWIERNSIDVKEIFNLPAEVIPILFKK